LQLVRRCRIPALFCALAVLVCELISRPYANMGICDDGPYILVAQKLASTGHIVYNGWSAAMLAWQLYLGAAFIKLFGFSFTTVRMSTLLVAVALAFFLQRAMVRAGIGERNATIGTLALVLSPLYLMLSVTFMSDIHGLFAIVLCLYGCLRALQSSTTRASIGWLCFAVATNAICGTSRQLAWLGILAMIPSTLWLLRAQRRVLLAGAAANLAGVLFILGCMVWLKHQPYTTPEKFAISFSRIPYRYLASLFAKFFFEFPFLLLPIMASFLLAIRKSRPRTIALVCGSLAIFMFLATHPSHLGGHFKSFLQPTLREAPGANWITINGEYESVGHGIPQLFLPLWLQGLLSAVCFGGVIVLILSFFRPRQTHQVVDDSPGISWKELGVIVGPFAAAYAFLLVFRAVSVANDNTGILFDRYSLGLLLVALICGVRQFQDRIQPQLPLAGAALVLIVAGYGVVITHNTFALYRARVAIAEELREANVPDTYIDNGWEYNIVTELHYANHINNAYIVLPAYAYVPTHLPGSETCSLTYSDDTPHIRARYSISFDPDACYGPAPFAPVHYSRWLASSPGTLYVVDYLARPKP
jgi:Dolichyl-phosphate-mannose-protein mannosyltransferase